MLERERFRDDITGYLKYYLFRASCGLVGMLPVRVTHGIGVAIAEITYRLLRRKRVIV
jgi:lauroyl/myristoyl acyltransferase